MPVKRKICTFARLVSASTGEPSSGGGFRVQWQMADHPRVLFLVLRHDYNMFATQFLNGS